MLLSLLILPRSAFLPIILGSVSPMLLLLALFSLLDVGLSPICGVALLLPLILLRFRLFLPFS